ncbi:MAG: orotate phosphoribosyltransferase [Bacteroidota bacterium]
MEKSVRNISEELARKLLQIKAIKLSPQNPFTWASGIQSPIYCDNRIVLSHPEVRNFVIQHLSDLSHSFGEFDTVAGVATAGIAHGALVANHLNKPFIYVRSKAKGHGRQNLIEGEVKSGAKVLVIEDLISTGGSSLQAVEALREATCEVVGVVAIFSYGFDRAQEAFNTANCPFTTLTTYPVLLEAAQASQYINREDVISLQNWRKAPEQWKQ